MSALGSTNGLENEIAAVLKTLVLEEGGAGSDQLDRFTKSLLTSVVISTDAQPPVRGVKIDNDGATLVRWSNVRFHWSKIATAAVDLAAASQSAHSDAFWFVKALQVFVQLKNVRDVAISKRMGLVYWAMWAVRDTATKEVQRAAALASAREVFAANSPPPPEDAEFTEHLNGLAVHGCLEVRGEIIRLRETAELARP